MKDLSTRLAADLAQVSKLGFMETRASAQLALDGTNTTGWMSALLISCPRPSSTRAQLRRSAPNP